MLPHHIFNRHRLKPRHLHHDFVELLHQPLDPDEKLVPAVAELWEDERRRRATRGLSLSEKAMMPGSGGMGGRTPGELGYLSEGSAKVENKGGDWKISDELWNMIEERMAKERRKKGRLSFPAFVGDIRGGKNGEKTKWDRWIPTTFQAVTAHWPRQPKAARSTQRSRKSRLTMSSSQTIPSSPLPRPTSPRDLISSAAVDEPPTSDPVVPSSPSRLAVRAEGNGSLLKAENAAEKAQEEPAEDADAESDEFDIFDEDNPFELMALTQSSENGQPFDADVNHHLISRAGAEVNGDDMDEEDPGREQHRRDARQLAEQGAQFRATQAVTHDDDDEFDDDELDELFRQTVAGGWSAASTPRRSRMNQSVTPTTVSRSGGSAASERTRRDKQWREAAGLADLR